MKFLVTWVVTIALVYGGWAYYNLYELTAAMIEKNDRELALRVDLEGIRAQHAAAHDQPYAPIATPPSDPIRRQSGGAPDHPGPGELVDMEWVRSTLARPANGRISWPSFAFFESPARVLIRYGDLGENPVHAYMSLKDWQWQLSAIFE